jgi:hypothetical protein
MNEANGSQISCKFKSLVHLVVSQSEHIVVSHEEFEAGDAIFDHPFHFGGSFVSPFGDGRVETVITVNLRVGPSSPSLVSLPDRSASRGDGEVDEGSSSSCDGSFGACIEIILGVGAHEGKLHVSVSIDSSRNEKFVRTVDDFGSLVSEVGRHSRDLSILNEDI